MQLWNQLQILLMSARNSWKTFLIQYFVLWNVRLRSESGFNLISSQTSIYFHRYYSEHTQQNLCISWTNRSWELLTLFYLFWLWFPFQSRGSMHSILLFIFHCFSTWPLLHLLYTILPCIYVNKTVYDS